MTIIETDTRRLWHPYTQHGFGQIPLEVVSGEGGYLILADGRRLLDGISSWWVNLHGHAHPAIARAVADQAAELEHVIFAGFTHGPAAQLAQILTTAAARSGARLERTFFTDNGSSAVEAALKIAYQYHRNRGDFSRKKFIRLKGAYHGDTLGAMSVSDPAGFSSHFTDLLFPVDSVRPDETSDLAALLASDGDAYAAMIVEPVIQGAGGMKTYDPKYLAEAMDLCRRSGVLFICDEIFTGFYRTGKLFAFEHAGISPDMICVSKGLTGGFLPLAATLCTEEIFQAFHTPSLEQAFLHGHSYTANPIACAAAIASWNLLDSPDCRTRIARIQELTRSWIEKLSDHPKTKIARTCGTIGVVEIRGEAGYASSLAPWIRSRALELGVLLRPLGNVLYSVPPYCLTDDEIHRIYSTMETILNELPDR